MAINTENVSIWWRHHEIPATRLLQYKSVPILCDMLWYDTQNVIQQGSTCGGSVNEGRRYIARSFIIGWDHIQIHHRLSKVFSSLPNKAPYEWHHSGDVVSKNHYHLDCLFIGVLRVTKTQQISVLLPFVRGTTVGYNSWRTDNSRSFIIPCISSFILYYLIFFHPDYGISRPLNRLGASHGTRLHHCPRGDHQW